MEAILYYVDHTGASINESNARITKVICEEFGVTEEEFYAILWGNKYYIDQPDNTTPIR
jgi:hypothetical protein